MRDQVRIGALCWLSSVEFLVAQLAAHLAWPAHNLFLYDISLLGISDCGVFVVATSGSTDLVCSPLHLVFNIGIVLHGALTMMGVWLTRSLWPASRTAASALLLLALGGAGAMTVGAFPVDDHMLIHIVGAVIAIAAPGLGLLLLSRSVWTTVPTLARWTALVGALVLLAGLGHALGGLPFGRGTMERLAVWPQTLWFVAVGAMLLRTTAVRKPRAAPLRPTRTAMPRQAAGMSGRSKIAEPGSAR